MSREIDRLRKQKNASMQKLRNANDGISLVKMHIEAVLNEQVRVNEIVQAPMVHIDDIDNRFKKATKLDTADIAFLFFATALQCVRQYVIGTITQRVGDQEAAKKTKGHTEEHSNRHHRLYHPSLEEIITNPVPFDAIFGSKDFDLGIGGGFNHRAKTLGHDPLLGWVFGTMNIATSTVTVAEGFRTFHVLTGETANGTPRDKISKNADTIKALNITKNKLLSEDPTEKLIIGTSLIKEAIHLKSDIYSTASIPIPIVSSFSVDWANKLADYGMDMGNILKFSTQAGFAILINALISMIHGLCYNEAQHTSWSLYSVKTRKILSYSNVIASMSNVIAVTIGAISGVATENPEVVKKSLNYLDIGGIMVTIYRLISDTKFINDVKEEFLREEFYDRVVGSKYDFLQGV